MNSVFRKDLVSLIAPAMDGAAGRAVGLRKRKKEQRRERILAAALEAFNSRGFAATTMQEIAAVAEVAVGTLYNYFPSKNDLLVGLLEEEMEDMRRLDPREIVRLLRSESDGAVIVGRVVVTLLEKTFVLSKENWREIFAALFANRDDLNQVIHLDFEAIEMLARLLRILQRRRMVRRDVAVEAMAVSLYSVVTVQFLNYLYVPGADEEGLLRGVTEQIGLVFEGIRPQRRS